VRLQLVEGAVPQLSSGKLIPRVKTGAGVTLDEMPFQGRRLKLTPQSVGGWLVAVSVMLALGLWSFGAILLWTMRDNELAKTLRASENMVATMSNDIARNLDMFDLSLQGVIENLNHPGVDAVSKDIRQLVLFDRAATAKYLASIKVLNEHGVLTLDSRTLAHAHRDYSSRDYFLVHQDNPNIGLYIGHPFVGGSGRFRVGISRRLSHLDGSFAGVVVGTLELDYFRDMFGRVKMSPGSVLALIHANGTLLMRNPARAGDIGRDMTRSELFKHAPDSETGHFQSIAATDGIRRLYSYHRIGAYPLFVVSGVSTADALATWRHDALAIGGILLVLGLSTIALARFASRELRRRERAETRLKALATTDALTQICNRRGFELAMGREWNDAFSAGSALGLLMIDADHFKDFNDEHGHQAGDRALVSIGHLLDDARRDERDTVARYGGEEFAVILPGASLDRALEIAENVRARAAAAHDADGCFPTLSIGVASQVPNVPDAADILIACADSALYKAKVDGRNRTEPDQSLLAKGGPRLAA
jgi:diguanylate cyclase (GGDEF)-like protein